MNKNLIPLDKLLEIQRWKKENSQEDKNCCLVFLGICLIAICILFIYFGG
jgi:hypothetical protein